MMAGRRFPIILIIFLAASPLNATIPSTMTQSGDVKCIPVMGLGFNEDIRNFVPRLLNSIDFCVDHFVIVVPKRLSNLVRVSLTESSQHLPNIEFKSIPRDVIGVAETWNVILNAYPSAPWFLISAYDVMFLPGQLSDFSKRFWKRSGLLDRRINATVNFAHTKWFNMHGGKGFNLFALTQEVVHNVGFFDENIYPAFWEDRDYLYRLKLWGGAKIRTFGDIKPIHGIVFNQSGHELSEDDIACIINENSRKKYVQCDKHIIPLVDYISGTKYISSNEISNEIRAGGKRNFLYAIQKWGCDPLISQRYYDLKNCTYSSPFNSGEHISFWNKNKKE